MNKLVDVPDLIILNASELITLKGYSESPKSGSNLRELDIIENGAIAVTDDKISFVGTTKELLSSIDIGKNTEIINAKGNVVLPGFVDPHTHLIFDGSRENDFIMKLEGMSYLEILNQGGGILNTVSHTRAASIDKLVQNGITIVDNLLIHGVTTVEAKSGYGLNTETELKMLEAIERIDKIHPIDIVATFLGAHAVPPEYKGNTEGYVELILEDMLPKVAKQGIAKFCDVFCEEGVFSIEQSKRILTKAREYGLIPKIHADEIVSLGGAGLAAELHAISADHLLRSTEEDLIKMRDAGVIAVLLPGTPFTLMESEYANARRMIELGLPIAIASDLNPNCFTESIHFIIDLACYNMKMTPAEVISATTINAAHAIGLNKSIGSLEVGKQADVQILNIPNYKYLSYKVGTNLTRLVIKKGKIVVKDRQRV